MADSKLADNFAENFIKFYQIKYYGVFSVADSRQMILHYTKVVSVP